MKRLLVVMLVLMALAAIPAYGQFPAKGDDLTTSLGSFKIQINPQFQPMFNGCPGYSATTNILQSPTMYDPATLVGRSDVILDGDANDTAGVPVGSANTVVAENMLFPPPGYPCQGVTGCTSGAGTREVHTEVRSLKMTSGPVAVRAGLWYNDPTKQTPPTRVSPGEVESQSGPGGAPAKDFPASSFFDIFVRVDVPACGTFPGATLYNSSPLLVKNYKLTQFPPRVVYLHDASTVVPILFLTANPGRWNADDILGYFVLAGHGVGFTNSQADINEFNNFMNCQTVSSPPPPTGTTKTGAATKGLAVTTIGPGPGPGPGPTPTPTPVPTCTSTN
jgi:hypothetical protein